MEMRIALGFRAAAAASMFFLVAACAQDSGDAAGAPADESLDPEAVALRVEYTGGFVTPAMLAGRLPIISVYGDGRVITEGPVPAIFPGPALPNVQVRKISAAEVDKLVERARTAGVGAATDFGQPPVADAPSTRFTVLTDGGTKTTEVYALNEANDAGGLTAEQNAARAKLRDLLTSLSDPAATGQQSYQPTALAAIASPWVAGDASTGKQPEIAWPGPQLPGKPVGSGLDTGCVTVTGADTAKVLTAAAKANAITPWTSGGKKWTVTLRPLLPDESDCSDLIAA
jgi:hypothetical protein